jgi:hypothetical protein
VNKEDNPLFSYAYLDSQRLKETFFTPPKKKKKKDSFQKNIIITSGIAGLLILVTGMIFFFNHYLVITVSRQGIELEKNSTSLLHSNIVNTILYSGFDSRLMKKTPSLIHLSMPPREKNGIIIDLNKPVNLQSQLLLLYLKKPVLPMKIAIVIRDNRLYSNSLRPIVVETNDQDQSEYLKLPIEFKSGVQNTNLAQITQVQLYFYPFDSKSEVKKEFPTQRWVIIKELLMVKASDDPGGANAVSQANVVSRAQ